MRYYLRHSLPAVVREGVVIHGGSQSWLPQKYMQKSGCGVIAGTDLLLYFHLYKKGCRTDAFAEAVRGDAPLSCETYGQFADRMHRRFFPVFPWLGMSGWTLMLGVNLYFWRYGLPLWASWRNSGKRVWNYITEMLTENIPVPMTIGQNIPFPWTKHKLTFYTRRPDGVYYPSCQVKAHFVTVTGMDDTWLRITSWGREYYIRREEYTEYVRKYSSRLVCGILTVKKRNATVG